MLKRPSLFSTIRQYIIITFGLLVYSFSINTFMLPSQIVGGGVNGIGVLIYYATGFPLPYSYLLFNAFLVMLGFKVLGRHFGFKTVYGIMMVTLLLRFIPIPAAPVLKDPLLCAIITGILNGAGVGLLFTQGGSTGGIDIVASIITKYRNISVGRVFLYCDVLIVTSAYLLHHSVENVVFSYIFLGLYVYSIDMVLSGTKQSVQIFIFSKFYEPIADRITTEHKRGVTVLSGLGWFTKNESKVLLILARKTELSNIYRIVKAEDSDAFISVANVMGVFGEGFEKIKAGKKIAPLEMIAKRKKRRVRNQGVKSISIK